MTIARSTGHKPSQIWSRALSNVANLAHGRVRGLGAHIDDLADLHEDRLALRDEAFGLTYRELAQEKNRVARWTRQHMPGSGEVVCLFMLNHPSYLALWAGIGQAGSIGALINTNLRQDALLHAINVSSARHIIVDSALAPALLAIAAGMGPGIECWLYGGPGNAQLRSLELITYSSNPLTQAEEPDIPLGNTALLIFTSGTTGMPKAARITHYTVLEWGFWFAGLMNVGSTDRLYNCLPMYHSTGGVACLLGVLLGGGAVIVRQRFSVSRFWRDVQDSESTIFVYIGELCRYLVAAAPAGSPIPHHLRLCCGNGLQRDVWQKFITDFHIPQILEFYASTEGNVSLYNCEGLPGAVGRVPPYLAHRFPVAVVQCDLITGDALRGADNLCLRAATDMPGEVLGRIADPSQLGPASFTGYNDPVATERKILRDVFEPGDAWFRTGDLMTRDAKGFFWFVDRLGDSFRWKGENVSAAQVAETVGSFPGVAGAVVFGVAVAGQEGRAGMAAITVKPAFSLAPLYEFLADRLPTYACPVFIRICEQLETTGTFKPVKTKLVGEGYDISVTADPLYIADHDARSYRDLRSGAPNQAVLPASTVSVVPVTLRAPSPTR